MGPVRVEILHIAECPNWVEAGARVREALGAAGLSAVDVSFRLLSNSHEAAETAFAGSPTILIDGSDAFPGGARTADLACRVYRTPSGFVGVPSVAEIGRAIRARLDG